jgi:TolB-like protein
MFVVVVVALACGTRGAHAQTQTAPPAEGGVAEHAPSAVGPSSSTGPALQPMNTVVTEEPVRVVVPDFTALTDDIVEAEVENITATVVYQLSKVPRLAVVSAADIRHMLDLEASKQTMGCSEETSCLTEIADALGAPLLVTGQISRLGSRLSVSLALIDAANAVVVKRAQAEGRDLFALSRALKPAVNLLVEEYGGVPGATVDESRTTFMRALADRANDPDTVMLFAVMAIGVVSPFFLPLVWLLPVLQAVAMWTLGDDLAGREYPAWWLAIPVGYLALAAGTILGTAFSVASIYTVNVGQVSQALAFAGAGTIFVTLFVVEPLAVWIAGSLWAHDIEIAKREAESTPEETPATDEGAPPASPGDVDETAPPSEAEPAAGDALGSFFSGLVPHTPWSGVVGGAASAR